MTGFGRASETGEGFAVSVELKSVNNRYLDVHLRTGSELTPQDTLIRRKISERLTRGRVDVNINIDRTTEVSYEINRPLVAGYIEAMRTMHDEFGVTGEPDVNIIARLPGALQVSREGVNQNMIEALERALSSALDELEQMRAQEGEALAAEMKALLDQIETHVPIIESLAGEQVTSYRSRVQKRIMELLARDGLDIVQLDQGRLAQEVAYLADRSDISEELARLKSHVTQFRSIIENDGEAGKRLDFLLQEFNREANTVLSKSTDLAIKESALAIKAAVEKLREQVQNVE